MLIHFSEEINTTLMNVHGVRSLAWHKQRKQGEHHKIHHVSFNHAHRPKLKCWQVDDWLLFSVTCAQQLLYWEVTVHMQHNKNIPYPTILIISYFQSSSWYDVISLLLIKARYYLLKGFAQTAEQCHERIQRLEQTCVFLEKERAVNLDQLE